jgi:hypothetical protein
VKATSNRSLQHVPGVSVSRCLRFQGLTLDNYMAKPWGNWSLSHTRWI